MNTIHKSFAAPELAFMAPEEIAELYVQAYEAESALNDYMNIASGAEDRVNKENESLGQIRKSKRAEVIGRIIVAQLTANLYSANDKASRIKDKHTDWKKTRFSGWGKVHDAPLPEAYLFRRKK